MGKATRTFARGAGATVSLGPPGANVRAYNPVAYLAPGAAALLLWVLALMERAAFRADTYAWYWSAAVVLAYGGLTAFAWWAARPRGPKVVLLVAGSTGFAGAWTSYLVGVPVQTWRPHVVYLGAALLSWACCVVYLSTKGTGNGDGSRLDDLKGAVAKLRAVNEVATTPHGEITARYEMEPGTPAADLQKDAAVLASLIPGMRPDGVRLRPSKDDAVLGSMRLSPIDRLATPMAWRAPSIPEGGTADDPIRLGQRETGGWAELHLTADPAISRGAPLVAIVGMSGSGKTVLVKILGLEILSRPDIEYWLADPRKAGQLPDWLRRGAARVASGRPDVAVMLKDFNAGISERSDQLGAHGCEVWSSRCCYRRHGIRLRILLGDEMAAVASDLPELLTNIGESARSTGSVPIFIFQRGTGDRFPTSARSQFNTHICLGVQEENDAVHGGLPDDVLDAGAQPWLWGADQPGMHILAAPGVPDDLRATSCRTFDTREAAAAMAAWANAYIEARAAGGPADVGDLVRSTEAAAPEQAGGDLATLPDADGEEYGETEQLLAEMLADDLEADSDQAVAELNAEVMAALHPDDAADMARIGVNDPMPECPPPPGDEVVALQPKMRPTEARRMFYRYVARLRDLTGAQRFQMADHIEAIHTATGMKKTWMYATVKEFCETSECGPAILVAGGEWEPYDIIAARPEIQGRDVP